MHTVVGKAKATIRIDMFQGRSIVASSRVFHVVVQDDSRVAKVADGKWVHHVEAHRPIHLAFEHDCMEVAQTKENGLGLGIHFFEGLAREEAECALEICLETA